jgi:2-polyprenyl-3-methyl-5-hydroxy-6-metoxy-1,4-benzoquinol methylase
VTTGAGATLALVETGCVVCGGADAEPEAEGPDFEHQTVPGEFRFVRCRACGHLYLNPRPSLEALPAIYPESYYAYSDAGHPLARRLRRLREARKVRIFREAIGEGPRRILDFGCGNGRLLSMLREHGSPAWELEGIDFSEEAVAQCRAKGFRATATAAGDFEAGDGGFDAVIMMQILEHLDDPRRTLVRVASLLRPGGTLVVETPNVGGLDYRWFRGRWWGMYHFPRHWNLFSTPALERLLRDGGFTVLRTDYLLSTSSWILSLHNLLLDRGWPERLVRRFHFQNPALLPPFASIDLLRMCLGLETSDQRVIARKGA